MPAKSLGLLTANRHIQGANASGAERLDCPIILFAAEQAINRGSDQTRRWSCIRDVMPSLESQHEVVGIEFTITIPIAILEG